MVKTVSQRDELLTEFGKKTLSDRYLLPGESYQDLFARVATYFSDDEAHAERMYDYISKHWFMPSTPNLSNGGTNRGLTISCFLNAVPDSMPGIAGKWNENIWLGSGGGGIGTNWSQVRSIGENVGNRGTSSGIIPFIRVMDSLTLAVSQGSLRRGSGAAYLNISHPEIEEFLEIRRTSGDFNRKSLNLHHGVVIPDSFMEALERDGDWQLVDPNSGKVRKTLKARELAQRILEIRMQTGEPYLLFRDNVNRAMPAHQRLLGLTVEQSNLCSEITLPTGLDHHGRDRTAVCNLGSVNLELSDEWLGNQQFIEDCMRFLDNVLEDFIEQTKDRPEYAQARYSAASERSIGLGVMGFHSYLQRKGIPFESALAKSFNLRAFSFIQQATRRANIKLALERGACPDSAEAALIDPSLPLLRFSNVTAIAPTASISIIAGGASPCIEPWNNNVFVQKTLSGSFEVRNKYLEAVLEEYGKNTPETWNFLMEHEGSVAGLEFLTDLEKAVFKTAWEIDNRWIVELACDRAPLVDQAQSVNMFLDGHVHKWDLLMLHYKAWKGGLKSLYYLRSRSAQRTAFAGVEADNKMEREKVMIQPKTDYEECLACQ